MSLPTRMRILIAILCIVILLLGGIVMFRRLILGPKPPIPDVTRGEFDFRLKYELNGERFVIEDTLVVEFDGFSADSGSMAWFRTWRKHLASNPREENILLLELNDGRRVYYMSSRANYLMGDLYLGISKILQRREYNPNWYPFNGVILEYPSNVTPEVGARFIGGLEDLWEL